MLGFPCSSPHPSLFLAFLVEASKNKLAYHGTNGTFSCAARPVNQIVHQVGRAWVARHGMSTYKDTTPHSTHLLSHRPSLEQTQGWAPKPLRSVAFLVFVSERHACYGPRAQEDSSGVLSGCAMYIKLFYSAGEPRSAHWVAQSDTTYDCPLAIPNVAAHATTFLRYKV